MRYFIYGIGSFAFQLKEKFEKEGIGISGFVDDLSSSHRKEFCNLPVVTTNEFINNFDLREVQVFVAIGYSQNNIKRKNICDYLKNNGVNLFSFISRRANISSEVQIGENTCICEGAYIGPNTQIGNGTIVMANVVIGHDTIIKDNVYIANSVSLGGNLVIKENTFIGLNATIKNGIVIGEYSVIGQASNVLHSTEPYSVYVGNPAMRLCKKSFQSII